MTLNSRKLVFIDALGALLSLSILIFILIPYQPCFGMPFDVLKLFTMMVAVLLVYSTGSYWFGGRKVGFHLFVIATLNIFYCLVNGFFLIIHWSLLTFLGKSFFLIEIVVILMLALIELKSARRLKV